jgi:uncharacterized surface protein with fasciclin (FAS1) repeats
MVITHDMTLSFFFSLFVSVLFLYLNSDWPATTTFYANCLGVGLRGGGSEPVPAPTEPAPAPTDDSGSSGDCQTVGTFLIFDLLLLLLSLFVVHICRPLHPVALCCWLHSDRAFLTHSMDVFFLSRVRSCSFFFSPLSSVLSSSPPFYTAEIACDPAQADTFSILCTLVSSSEAVTALLSDPTQVLTVFAPTNAAFENAPPIGVGELDDLLGFHVVAGQALKSTDLVCKATVGMANGKSSRTTCDNNQNASTVWQRGADNVEDALPQIIGVDMEACGGSIIHIINNVMLPSGFLPDITPNSGDRDRRLRHA